MLKISNYQIFSKRKKIRFYDSKDKISLENNKLYYMKQLTKKLSPIAHFCNTEKSKNLLQKAISKKIIDEDCLIIIHNQNPPKNSKNYQKLSKKIDLKKIRTVCCWSKFDNDESIDMLYQILKKYYPKIVIHDEILFIEHGKSFFHKYRGIKYSQDKESHLPSHFANDAYIDELNRLVKSSKNSISHMDICAGQGSIGFSLFNENKNLTKLFSVEINPTQVIQMRKTLKKNKISTKNIQIIRSDALNSVPKNIKVDLVSGNTPHTNRYPRSRKDLQGADLGWNFHKNFFNSISEHLNPNGIITLLENGNTSKPDMFKSLLPSHLKIYNIKYLENTSWYVLFIKSSKQ